MSRRSSPSRRRGGEAYEDAEPVESEEDDALLELFSIRARGDSHFYSINGDTSVSISLRNMLGFLSETDYYAYFVSRGLAQYVFDRKKRKMRVEFVANKWPDYLNSRRYGLTHGKNVEFTFFRLDMKNLLCGRTQCDADRERYYVVRLGRRDSPTYATTLGRQKVFLPTTPGWRAKQRYFRRMTNDLVTETLIENEQMYEDAMEELELKIKPKPEEQDPETPPSPDPKRSKFVNREQVPDGEPKESYWRGCLSTAVETLVSPFAGLFPFTNRALGRDSDFDLGAADDVDQVDRHLTDFIGMKQRHSKNKVAFQYVDTRNLKQQSYVKVASATTDKSYRTSDRWIDEAVAANSRKDGNKSNSIQRMTKSLLKRDEEAVREALAEAGIKVVRQMDTVAEAAMYDEANVAARTKKRVIRRHIRHQWGKNALGSENALMALTEGHSEVFTDTAYYPSKDGGKDEKIEFSIKNLAREIETLIPSIMEGNQIAPKMVGRVDVTTGGDHGKGALQHGAQVTTVVKDAYEVEGHDDDDSHSFTFNTIIAEVICKKDNSEILKLTINNKLSEAMKEIAESKVEFQVSANGKVKCRFIPKSEKTLHPTCAVHLYAIADLAYYGMVLGREHMMGDWCYLCTLSHAEFQDLLKEGDDWTWSMLEEIAKKVKDPAFKGQSYHGVKEAPWWTFIPLTHFLPPLLHLLMGIWNDIWDRFRMLVSEYIDYIDKDEADLRAKKEDLIKKIADLETKKKDWKESPSGKARTAAVARRGRIRKALNDVRQLNDIGAVNAPSNKSAVGDLMAELDAFIDADLLSAEDAGDDEGRHDENDDTNIGLVESNNPQVQGKIVDIKKQLKDVQGKIDEFDKAFKKFSGSISRAKAMLKKVKEAILTFKSARSKSGDGIETQLFAWMKLMFRIQQPAYHGGKLIGKDCVQMMGNAYEMFDHFKVILKTNRREDSPFTFPMIDEMCADFARVSILWDGAFSLASKINPPSSDIVKFKRFARAGIYSHKAMALSITHKAHLMKGHVARAMAIPGGLGKKREDWLEHQHQEGHTIRTHYRTTQQQQVRANAIAGATHSKFNPELIAKKKEVKEAAERGPRKDYVSVEEVRRLKREENREKELHLWESLNSHIIAATSGDESCKPVKGGGTQS